MRAFPRWLGFSLLLTTLALVGRPNGRAADDFKVEDGFTSLFNGRDLSGWTYKGSKESLEGKAETTDKRFSVTDGAIVANEGKGIKELTTVKEFNKDFILKLEFRAGPKADSGVYVRGPQLQVRDYLRRGEQPGLAKVFKNDGWNELEISVRNGVVATVNPGKPLGPTDELIIKVRGGKAEATVNGASVAGGDVHLGAGVLTVCKCNGIAFDGGYKAGPKGGIGLQAESGKFEFRRLRIKEQ